MSPILIYLVSALIAGLIAAGGILGAPDVMFNEKTVMYAIVIGVVAACKDLQARMACPPPIPPPACPPPPSPPSS